MFDDDGKFHQFRSYERNNMVHEGNNVEDRRFWYLYVASDNVYLEAASLVDQLSQLNRLFAFMLVLSMKLSQEKRL